MRYLNASKFVKTFYGVIFNPGESHDVPGYINVPGFIRVADLPKEPPKAVKPATELPKQPAKSTAATAKPQQKSTPAKKEVDIPAVNDELEVESELAEKSENSTTQ